MHKTLLCKQAQENLDKVKVLASQIPSGQFFTKAETDELLKALREAEQSILVLQYVLNQQELSGEWNVHVKIMEQQNKQEVIIDNNAVASKEETVPPQAEQDNVNAPRAGVVPATVPYGKKVELSINDRFRITNELFKQNKHEFEIALGQLNVADNWNEAKVYLAGLAGLYQWDEEKDSVKLLHRLVQKRFS